MTMWYPVNPSFFVLTILDRDDVAEVNDQLGEMIDGEEGGALTPIGDERYVLARACAKQISMGRDAKATLAILEGLEGVSEATRMRANKVMEALQAREVGSRPQCVDHPPAEDGDLPEAQWNLEMVNAPQAWAMFPGGLPGRAWHKTNLKVGHIDTGYTEHPAFGPWEDHRSPNILVHLGINYVDKGSGKPPRDPINYDGNPGHGTRTASLLAGNLPGVLLGMAPGVNVVPYRLTNSVVIDAFGNPVKLHEAIHHAVFDAGCKVLSISLGDPCFPRRAVGENVDKAYEEGVIIVAAAGNITGEVVYPARYARTICVAGVTQSGKPWSSSARGRSVDICAPADEIYRGDVIPRNDEEHYRYCYGGDGTSYATVHVSGAAALWLGFRGDQLKTKYQHGWQHVEAFRQILKQSAFVPEPGILDEWDHDQFGAGILDAAMLLRIPLPDPASLLKNEVLAATERQRHSDEIEPE